MKCQDRDIKQLPLRKGRLRYVSCKQKRSGCTRQFFFLSKRTRGSFQLSASLASQKTQIPHLSTHSARLALHPNGKARISRQLDSSCFCTFIMTLIITLCSVWSLITPRKGRTSACSLDHTRFASVLDRVINSYAHERDASCLKMLEGARLLHSSEHK